MDEKILDIAERLMVEIKILKDDEIVKTVTKATLKSLRGSPPS